MLELQRLTRRYGDLVALDGLSFTVAEGQLFGFVGAQRHRQDHRHAHHPRRAGAQRRRGPMAQTPMRDGMSKCAGHTPQEDMVYAIGSFRIRQYFPGLDPAAVLFFPPTDPWGMTKLERIGVVATGPLQLLLTEASMVDCINAIVGGMAVALAVRSLLDVPVPVAAVAGTLVGLAAACFAYQVRRFRRAAAVVPELYEGQGPGMPGWPTG